MSWGALACSRDSPLLLRQLSAKGLPIVHSQPSQAIHLQPQGHRWDGAGVQAKGMQESGEAAERLTAVVKGFIDRKIVDLSKNLYHGMHTHVSRH